MLIVPTVAFRVTAVVAATAPSVRLPAVEVIVRAPGVLTPVVPTTPATVAPEILPVTVTDPLFPRRLEATRLPAADVAEIVIVEPVVIAPAVMVPPVLVSVSPRPTFKA